MVKSSVCMLLTCTSCRVLQEVQQDEAWAETEAAPRSLPVRNVLQDDVAALLLFLSHVFMKYENFSYHTDRLQFWYLDFLVPLFLPFLKKIIIIFLKGPYFSDFPHVWFFCLDSFVCRWFHVPQFVLSWCCRPLRLWNTVDPPAGNVIYLIVSSLWTVHIHTGRTQIVSLF